MQRALATLFLALAFTGCAPTYRVITKKCPTTASLLGDFGLTATSLALSALHYNRNNYGQAAGYAVFGMGLALADNLSEGPCKR